MASTKKPAKPAQLKPVKFAKGKEVRVKRGGVALGTGRYVGSVEKVNGTWHQVNMAPKGSAPDVGTYRASNLERVG